MKGTPRITIVTPSFNQRPFIAETIESVRAQAYSNLEHLVMDGGSTDGTLEILARYPHLQVFSARDRGQADAVNKGFARATGDVWGFVNSDDTLLPGALERVAREIDPARGRHVVMGRCLFIDGDGRSLGIEHPSAFESFARVLQVWKGHTIPQPAVFWTPEVWRTCGPLDLDLKYHLDYDLFCRFARRYRFHAVDQVLATYRLHPESKTEEWGEAERLEDSIRLSRRYWGAPWMPLYWRVALSLAWYRFDRVGRARRLYLDARERRRLGSRAGAWPRAAAAAVLAPEVGFYLGVYPRVRRHASRLAREAARLAAPRRRLAEQTRVYLNRTAPWDDGWVGPALIVSRTATPGAREITVSGAVDLSFLESPFSLAVWLDGRELARRVIADTGAFAVAVAVPDGLAAGEHEVAVRASAFFVHHDFAGSGDYRPLSWRLAGPDAVAFR